MRKLLTLLIATIMTLSLCACTASDRRRMHDAKSDLSGGINRVVRVYTADGKKLAEYEGKIDLAPYEEVGGGVVKFDLNGKRYIYYNCYVETIGDL